MEVNVGDYNHIMKSVYSTLIPKKRKKYIQQDAVYVILNRKTKLNI